MRQALNSNPLLQLGAIAALGVIVAFLMLTRMKGEEPKADPTPFVPPGGSTAAPAAPGAGEAATAPTAPATTPAVPGTTAEPASPSAEFTAGPGLPEPFVRAHESGDTVVLLVTRKNGVDDRELGKHVVRLLGERGVTLFHSFARDVADYSRIAQGVDIDRVPALVVLSPRSVSGEGLPSASVSYGFRDYESILQAVRDAGYKGKQLPYSPTD